jgi:phenylacetate-CoA ligase
MNLNLNKSNQAVEGLRAFLSTSLDAHVKPPASPDPPQSLLALFQSTAATTPAYRAFLAEHGIQPDSVQTPADLQRLPVLTKDNYLRRYPLPDLCRNGRLEDCDMIAVSSGSTGTPCFWPRFLTDELRIAWRFEQIFQDSFRADERRTLAVICFALGTWVGGMYTAACCRHLAAKGYPLTVITPGSNKAEILRVVQELGGFYDQVVLLGYPPFLKDVVDEGIAKGMDWPRYSIKMVMAGEVFSEEWRDLVGQRVGSSDPCYDSASLYGTADAGVLGNETPLSICIRRFLAANPHAARELFGESRLPTLVQYAPLSRYFEMQNGQLLFSGDNGIPLLRYNLLDTGGIASYEEMLAFCGAQGFDPLSTLSDRERGTRELPFAWVFGRSDFTVSYFGANIFPENITVGLEQDEVAGWVTGKFVLQVEEDADRNRYLAVIVELAPNITGEEARHDAIAASIRTHLLRLNSEFANYVPAAYQQPRLRLALHGDPEFFPPGVKHRYTRKS